MTPRAAAAVVVAGLTLLAVARPSSAAMVEITASVAAADANDQAVVHRAIQTAVDELVNDGLPFKPTVMVVTRAQLVGGRLYVRVLLSDEDGDQLSREASTSTADPATAPHGDI